jgi:hypothetical protein
MNALGAAILVIALGAAASPIQAVYDAESRGVVIPRVEARAVKLDGTFSPGEWDGAVRFRISRDIDLYLAADREALRIGLKYATPATSVDLFLTSDRREFLDLHASMRLGESRLAFPRTPEAGLGRLEIGRHVDWDANHQDQATSPAGVDGFEFRILRRRIGNDRLWLALQTWCEDRIGYPAAADLRSADGWVELVLPPLKPPVRTR